MKCKGILLFGLLLISAMNGASGNHCINSMLLPSDISKLEFLECKRILSEDQINSDEIFIALANELLSDSLVNLYDPTRHVSFLPADYDFYNFKEGPEAVHRYRAINEILKQQLSYGNVSDEVLIHEIEKGSNNLVNLISIYNRNFSEAISNCFYQKLMQNKSTIGPIALRNRKLYQKYLLRANPEKYINIISKFVLENYEREAVSFANHEMTYLTQVFLSKENRIKLIENLYAQLQSLEAVHAGLILRAIDQLSGFNFISSINVKRLEGLDQNAIDIFLKEEGTRFYKEKYKSALIKFDWDGKRPSSCRENN